MRYRFFRVLSVFFNRLLGVALRAIIPALLFGACVVEILHLMGVPLPSAHELMNGFEGLSRVAKIFL